MMKMKPYHSVVVLAVLVFSAVAASVSSYHRMQKDIECDLDRALVITLHERRDKWLTPDTIQDYRSHLSIAFLKETSLLCYVIDDKRGLNRQNAEEDRAHRLASKTMTLNSHAVRGYANCSFADVFGQSDQRLSLLLTLLSVLWLFFTTWHYRDRRKAGVNDIDEVMLADNRCVAVGCTSLSVGALTYLDDEDRFFNHVSQQMVRFTPMQHQLMRMFFASKLHQISKQDICASLWPKKPDASETLYTLIRRIKPIVENNQLTIESERGMAYRLRERTEKD